MTIVLASLAGLNDGGGFGPNGGVDFRENQS
jgi:hypothetical protein